MNITTKAAKLNFLAVASSSCLVCNLGGHGHKMNFMADVETAKMPFADDCTKIPTLLK